MERVGGVDRLVCGRSSLARSFLHADLDSTASVRVLPVISTVRKISRGCAWHSAACASQSPPRRFRPSAQRWRQSMSGPG